MASLWKVYLGLLSAHPLKTKCITSGLIMLAGDGIQQAIEYRSKCRAILDDTHKMAQRMPSFDSSSPMAAAMSAAAFAPALPSFSSSYDWGRSLRSGLFGGLAVGPIFHVWFRTLDRMVPGGTLKPVLKKMLIDQGFMAPVFTVFYFATMGTMEGKSPKQIGDKIRTATWPTLFANYCIFPFSQFVNFYYVPQHLRVLVLNAGGLVYNVYLSRYNAAPTEAEDAEKAEGSKRASVLSLPAAVEKAQARS